MKIYLAHPDLGPLGRVATESALIRTTLAARHHTVMPQIDETDESAANLTSRPWWGENAGHRIVADITACDLLVAWTFEKAGSGRIDACIGYALALEKPVALLGPVTNVIHCLPQVTRYLDAAEILDALEKLT